LVRLSEWPKEIFLIAEFLGLRGEDMGRKCVGYVFWTPSAIVAAFWMRVLGIEVGFGGCLLGLWLPCSFFHFWN
jgi:hypothetical protein